MKCVCNKEARQEPLIKTNVSGWLLRMPRRVGGAIGVFFTGITPDDEQHVTFQNVSSVVSRAPSHAAPEVTTNRGMSCGLAVILVCFVAGTLLPLAVEHTRGAKWHHPTRHQSATGDASGKSDAAGPLNIPFSSSSSTSTPNGTTAVNMSTGWTLDSMRMMCADRFDLIPHMPQWRSNATLSEMYSTRGERLFCSKGRQLFRDFDTETWELPRGGTPLTRLTPELIAQHNSQPGALVMHASVAVVTTTLLSLYHMLNDFVIPWPYIWSMVLSPLAAKPLSQTSPSTDPMRAIPLEYVLLHINGTLRGRGSDEIAILALSTLVQPNTSLRTLIHGDRSDQDPVLHCYCRAVLQPPTVLLTYGPQSYIIEGDAQRRASTHRFKNRIAEMHHLLPYGAWPIPAEVELFPFGLWTSNKTAAALGAPRLLLLLRKSTRLIGGADAIVEACRSVGFNVHVMTPELEPVTQQVRAARYADVLVGIHGQALTWLALMDGTRASHTRWVLELQHFGRAFKRGHNVYELLSADSALRYARIPAVSVAFDPNFVKNPKLERRLLQKRSFPHEMPGFSHQTAFHDIRVVKEHLERIWSHMSIWWRKQEPYPITKEDLASGERVFKF